MKTIQLSVLLFGALCLQNVTAQVNNINVNGLILGNIYRTQDVEIKLGWHPTAVVKSEEPDAAPNSYTLYFEDDVVILSEFFFCGALLKSDRFWIGGPGRQIRVGDDMSKLQPCLGGTFREGVVVGDGFIGYKEWRLDDYPYDGYEVKFYYNEENKIAEIEVMIMP